MKRFLIHLVDIFDNWVLRHRVDGVCVRVSESKWWGDGVCECWYCRRARRDS